MGQRSVLITGASGFIGRAAADAFAHAGWQVIRLARKGGDLSVDLAGPCDLPPLILARPDLVLHLAASVPQGSSGPDSDAAGAATRRMDGVICAAVRAWGCRLIYASSCGLYRRDLPHLKDETAQVVDWNSPYFAAKLAGESAARALPHATILRISSPVGASLPPHLVVARFLALAVADADLPLFGDGSREQDFISLEDLTALFLAAAEADRNGTYNAASGVATTMRQLADTVIGIVGRGRIVMTGQPEGNDCLFARYDIHRTRRDLGWMPRRDLPAMIACLAESQQG